MVRDNCDLMSLDQFIEKYNVNTNFLEYQGILNALPKTWKELIKNQTRFTDIENELLIKVQTNVKSCNFFYKIFLKTVVEEPEKAKLKWSEQLDIDIENWETIFSSIFKFTKNNKISILQFKLLHRIVATNSFLYKCKLKETELCSFCNETRETLLHLFYSCSITRNLWLELANYIREKFNLDFPADGSEIILGNNNDNFLPAVNSIVLMVKYFIYCCKLKNEIPNIRGAISFVKQEANLEILLGNYSTPAARARVVDKWRFLELAPED